MTDKLTKIVATIGPACEAENTIAELIGLGVNIFRFNLKHNTLAWHGDGIKRVKKISEELRRPVGTLIDLQGPEIRIVIPGDQIELRRGEKVLLAEKVPTYAKGFTISAPDVIHHIEKGQKITVDDGRFEFTVEEKKHDVLTLKSHSEGIFKTRKSMNIPGIYFPIPVLTDHDKEAIAMGKKYHIEYVALSFVRQAKDIHDLRQELAKQGFTAKIVSKIETKMAIDNLDEIVASSDALMVARGDLGIELPLEQVPYYQKLMIKKCIERGIPVITATQMLESMIEVPYATRAEVSDIANAVFDYTDATMLSGETAYGKYPDKVVEIMSKTLSFSEKKRIEDTRALFTYHIADEEEMICDAAYNLYLQFSKKHDTVGGFVVFTHTGRTARKLSRYRPRVPIFAFTPDTQVRDSLTISYGVIPLLQPTIYKKNQQITKDNIVGAISWLQKKGLIQKDKYYFVLHGDIWKIEGKVSTIKVIPPQ